ncbi:MAG: ATP-binding cassette domain-containing protein, partial [Lactobacillus iners]|nr:ATP-binding cassette domain-containing protein [Lactobacillus iners]
MNKPIFELKNVTVLGNKNSSNVTKILNNLSLTINDGDFITVIGTNGAGKSTLLNVISGALAIDDGIILHNGRDITNLSEEEHTKFLSRVFQDPQLGTAPRMTVAE